jgi:hypothetical protein
MATRGIITIYITVISTEAGDKVFEPGFFFSREVSRHFDGLFDPSVARFKKTIKMSRNLERKKEIRRNNFSASVLITVI